VLRDAALTTPGAHRGNLCIVALLLGTVGAWGELDEGVQRDSHPGRIGLGLLHEVGVYAAKNGLVGDNKNILGTLKLHDDGLQADDNVTISGKNALVRT
jgi:hypothetical protein